MIRTLISYILRMTTVALTESAMKDANMRDRDERSPVIGLCPSRNRPRAWNHNKCMSVNHGQPGHGALERKTP